MRGGKARLPRLRMAQMLLLSWDGFAPDATMPIRNDDLPPHLRRPANEPSPRPTELPLIDEAAERWHPDRDRSKQEKQPPDPFLRSDAFRPFEDQLLPVAPPHQRRGSDSVAVASTARPLRSTSS